MFMSDTCYFYVEHLVPDWETLSSNNGAEMDFSGGAAEPPALQSQALSCEDNQFIRG